MASYEDIAHELVQNRFDDLEAYADTAFNLTKDYISNLTGMLEGLEVPNVSEIGNIDVPAYLPLDYTARPMLGNGIFTEKAVTAPTDISGFNNIDPNILSVLIEQFDAGTTGAPGAFSQNTVPRPTISIPEKPESTPLKTVTKPEAPTGDFPSVPTLSDIKLPDKISFDLGEFNANSPGSLDLSDPVLMEYTPGSYSSELSKTLVDLIAKGFASAEVYSQLILDSSTESLDVIIKKLLDIGSSGINTDVETLIYDRGKARLKAENDALYQQVANEFGSKGFNLPNGIFAANIARVQREISDKNDRLNYEIIVNQANLSQANRQFMIEKAVQLEGMLLNFFTETENRTLEAAKAVAANGLDVIRAKIDSYNAKLDLYKTEATVFELKLRAELSVIEIYKAQLQGASIESEIQKNTVDLYARQIEAQKVRYEAYKIEMEGAKLSMEVEQLKIQQLEIQTKIYLAETEAEKLKIEIYKEQNEAEKIRLEGHLAEIEAYKVKVGVEKEKLDAHFEEKRLLLQENTSLVDKYRADVAAYTAELQANDNLNEKELRAFQATVSAYEAETNADRAKNLMKIEEARTKIQEAQVRLDRIKSELDLTVRGYVAIKELQVKGIEGITNAGAHMTASSMNAANATASYRFDNSIGSTYSHYPDVRKSETHYHTYKEK